MKNRLRSFIAVPLSSSVPASIDKLIRTLRPGAGNDIRWVESKNMHITLKFLGDVPLNDLPQLIRTVTQGTSRINSFDITLQGLGAFPDWKSPKTIWVGCKEGSGELQQLADSISESLLPLGFPKEARRFSPHLTIGRVKRSTAGAAWMPMLDEHQHRHFGSCSVSEVLIMSSELTRSGPIYDELAAIPLQ